MPNLLHRLLARGRSPRAPGGLVQGGLAPCPQAPNCVSTQADDPAHRMEALPFEGSVESVRERILSVWEQWPRARVVCAERVYFQVECTTALAGFVDDVELLIDEEERVIHFRSASRIGYSDLGANRRRMEQFARRLGRTK